MADERLVAPMMPMVTTAQLRVRQEPVDGAVLATLEVDVVVGLDGLIEEDGWVPVTFSGWVSRRYLRGVDATT